MSRARQVANLSPTIADARMPNLTGDITTVEGAVATTIATDAVDIAMLSATGTAGSSTFLRGDNTWQTAGSTSASDLDSGTLAVARMAAGTVLQTKADTYITTSSITIGTGSDHVFDDDLEVAITRTGSHGNYLAIWLQLPNLSTEAGGRSLSVGFRYSTDTFSSSDVILGERDFTDVRILHLAANPLISTVNLQNWVAFPDEAGPIKIRVITTAYVGSLKLFNNEVSDGCVASLIVQEIKG